MDYASHAVPILGNASYGAQLQSPSFIPLMEKESPVGRAEFIKLFGAFYNLEDKANALFEAMLTSYQCNSDSIRTLNPVWGNKKVVWFSSDMVNYDPPYSSGLLRDAGMHPLTPPAIFSTDGVAEFLKSADMVILSDPGVTDLHSFKVLAGIPAMKNSNGYRFLGTKSRVFNMDKRKSVDGHSDYSVTG